MSIVNDLEELDTRAEELKEAHRKVDEHLRYWIPIMRLEHWTLNTYYNTGKIDTCGNSLAEVLVNWPYLIADATFYLGSLIECTDEDIEYHTVHELCHMLVAEMRETEGDDRTQTAVNHEERVVTNLAKAFINSKNK